MNDKVLIITVNYNQDKYTIECIKSILKSKYDNFSIVLVNNGSQERPDSYLKEEIDKLCDPRIILKRIAKNIGYVGGINSGLEEGVKLNPDYFLIMNNDTIIGEHSINELVKTSHKFYNNAIVSGKVFHYDEPEKLQDVGWTFKSRKKMSFKTLGRNERDTGQYNEVMERDMLDDVFWLFPYKLYCEIGGYSPYFWFNSEQADFALRAKKIGYKLIYTPNANLLHKGSLSLGGRDKNPKLVYWHIQSTLILRFLHLPKAQFAFQYFTIARGVLFTFTKSLIFKLLRRDVSMEYARAKLSGLLYFNKWILKRNKNTGQNPFSK